MNLTKSFLWIINITFFLLLSAFIRLDINHTVPNDTFSILEKIPLSSSSKFELSRSDHSSILKNPQQQKTPRPTATPLIIPPPTDIKTSRIIIFLGAIALLIVVFGVWINREKLRK